MPIDPQVALALDFEPVTLRVDPARLGFFASATGQTDPVYSDVQAAQSAGHPSVPIPPTFFFSLELEGPDPFGYLDRLGVDLRYLLHGEQGFTYHRMAYAGDELTLRSRIVDCYAKKGGELEFIVKATDVTRGDTLVAEVRSVTVVRNIEEAS